MNLRKLIKFRSQKGQSLVELLIAIGLATLILPALLTGLAAGRGGRAQQEQRLQATTYLKETQEAVRSIAERGWSNIPANGSYHAVISNGRYVLTSGAQAVEGFSISVDVSDAQRNSSGGIVNSGGTVDPSTKKVVTTVSWNTPLVSNVSSTSYFTRYKNLSYTETTSSQFNSGTASNIQVTNTGGGELKLINDNKAKWCSPAFSATTIDLPDGPPVAVAATASSSVSIPNNVYVATSPTTSNSIKMAYVTVTANTSTPSAVLAGKFTMNSSEFSGGYSPQTGTGLDNNFKTTDIKYYKSSAGKTYALMGTNLPNKEVIAVLVDDGDPSNNSSNTGEYQDPINKIFKYWTFFNTKIYSTYAPTDTGFLNPTSNASDTGGDGDGYATNPTRAYSDNNSFAVDTNSGNGTGTNCTGADKDKHRFYNYGVNIPSGSTINGIEVRLDAKADSTTGSPKICVQLSWDGGSTWTTAKTTANLTTGEVSYSLGGSTDNWGRTWADADFSNSNFRVRVIDVASDTTRDFSLDWATVKVYFNDDSYDRSPFGYGATSLAVYDNKGYVASGGFLYIFDLSNIDTKSTSSGLDMQGCRIQLDGYECDPGTSSAAKYSLGQSGSNWATTTPIHPDCSDGGNIELYATNDIYPVKVGVNTYVYVAVGGVTDREFEIVDVSTVPSTARSAENTCGAISGGDASWKVVSGLDFNSQQFTEEAANSVFAKSDGTRAYISSNGGVDKDKNGVPDSKQFYVINTSNKTAPAFLSGTSGSPSYGPTSGFYYGTGANADLYPRRSLTVLNGERVVLVGKDGNTGNSNNAEEYQVLNSSNEASPTYCAGINFDQGFNDLTSVTEADSDNFVYMVANTTLNELKIIEGGPDDAIYSSIGTFESAPFNATGESMFNRFFSTVNVPSQTTLTYQVAIADPVGGSCGGANYVYVGPDGTSSSYFTAAGELPKNSDGSGYENSGQCMRYKIYMSSNDQAQTPILYDFGVNYSP